MPQKIRIRGAGGRVLTDSAGREFIAVADSNEEAFEQYAQANGYPDGEAAAEARFATPTGVVYEPVLDS